MLRLLTDRLVISLGLSVLIGGLGYWRGSLTRGGWLGAVLIGTATVSGGGWTWGVLVVAFFVSSSALSHWRRAAKRRVAGGTFAKSDRRDLAQTLANGGAAAGLALLFAINPQPLLFAAFLGSLAAVTADTWATELGTLSTRPPRLITTGKIVSAGTSGGVTLAGTGATAAGALMIGSLAWLSQRLIHDVPVGPIIPAALIGGIAGSLIDSVLGATVQVVRVCPRCGDHTEQVVHRCGTPTEYLRGWRWLDNDWVNFLASIAGGAVGALIWLLG